MYTGKPVSHLQVRLSRSNKPSQTLLGMQVEKLRAACKSNFYANPVLELRYLEYESQGSMSEAVVLALCVDPHVNSHHTVSLAQNPSQNP